ncbi:L-serine ammonia-lyase [Cupriavidus agavae]|uniref:L-serine dehydratase n=1 Tax=Cupriavidus agavae TaxID=1001822 RepID=A0A4Q7R9M1_9BURK|nr:L-serine ammonia-lyase [Cupriavidus agavae]RZT28858.1 L-serine ammonia-lyase [Cupriavidus agavae]
MNSRLSVFDIFKVGVGPSSSHTVGPIRAAATFAAMLHSSAVDETVHRVRCELFGSLAATGKGHATDQAILLGLSGYQPDTVDVDSIPAVLEQIRASHSIDYLNVLRFQFIESEDLIFHRQQTLPEHPNGMRFTALSKGGNVIAYRVFYSIGGGFVVEEGAAEAHRSHSAPSHGSHAAGIGQMPFRNAKELLDQAELSGCSIAEVMLRNERRWRTDAQTRDGVLSIWAAMQEAIARGIRTEGVLPGPFRVRRRAPALFGRLTTPGTGMNDPIAAMDWINLYALAVNEENAAGGRIVTAPTNGAAGIVPAVLKYYTTFVPNACEDGVEEFLLTAAAIGMLFKCNASISGADVGCQGEVGVACSMAAAGLCAVLGGTPAQIENAAEIGMEHHLGMTCDPVGGLVQIPCIERNAIAAVKAVNAARMGLHGDGEHHVSLDQVIKTMRDTGADMSSKYKETSLGGLALNVVEC